MIHMPRALSQSSHHLAPAHTAAVQQGKRPPQEPAPAGHIAHAHIHADSQPHCICCPSPSLVRPIRSLQLGTLQCEGHTLLGLHTYSSLPLHAFTLPVGCSAPSLSSHARSCSNSCHQAPGAAAGRSWRMTSYTLTDATWAWHLACALSPGWHFFQIMALMLECRILLHQGDDLGLPTELAPGMALPVRVCRCGPHQVSRKHSHNINCSSLQLCHSPEENDLCCSFPYFWHSCSRPGD